LLAAEICREVHFQIEKHSAALLLTLIFLSLPALWWQSASVTGDQTPDGEIDLVKGGLGKLSVSIDVWASRKVTCDGRWQRLLSILFWF
jgi:hypothetical protein